MTDPVRPISKSAQITQSGDNSLLSSEPGTSNLVKAPVEVPSWKIEAQSLYVNEQASPSVGADQFISGEDVLAASLALFTPETAQKEQSQASPAEKTLELARLDYLLGLSSSKVTAKTESSSAESKKRQDEFANLYAAYASEQARLEKIKKSKNIWKRISEFLKSIFLK